MESQGRSEHACSPPWRRKEEMPRRCPGEEWAWSEASVGRTEV